MQKIMDPIKDLLIARMIQECEIGKTAAALQRHLNSKPPDNATPAEKEAWVEEGLALSDANELAALPKAWQEKGDAQDIWVNTCDYSDRYFSNEDVALRVY